MSEAYGKVVRFLVSRRITVSVMLLLFAGLLGATVYMLQVTPRGFIPPMDQGYAIVVIQLRSDEHPSELQSQMRISYAVFCLKNKHKQPDQLERATHNQRWRTINSKALESNS